MTPEKFKLLCRDAGINLNIDGDGDTWYGNQWLPEGALRKFAELVSTAEREACAQLVESGDGWLGCSERNGALPNIAEAIRARA